MRRVLVLLALVLLAPAALAGGRVEHRTYVGPTHDTSARFVDCHVPDGVVSVDGMCFPLDGSERAARVMVADASGLPIPVHLLWRSASGIAVGRDDFFCEPTQDLAVPAGAVVLLAWPLPDDSIDPAFGYCPTVHGAPTVGALNVAFS